MQVLVVGNDHADGQVAEDPSEEDGTVDDGDGDDDLQSQMLGTPGNQQVLVQAHVERGVVRGPCLVLRHRVPTMPRLQAHIVPGTPRDGRSEK